MSTAVKKGGKPLEKTPKSFSWKFFLDETKTSFISGHSAVFERTQGQSSTRPYSHYVSKRRGRGKFYEIRCLNFDWVLFSLRQRFGRVGCPARVNIEAGRTPISLTGGGWD